MQKDQIIILSLFSNLVILIIWTWLFFHVLLRNLPIMSKCAGLLNLRFKLLHFSIGNLEIIYILILLELIRGYWRHVLLFIFKFFILIIFTASLSLNLLASVALTMITTDANKHVVVTTLWDYLLSKPLDLLRFRNNLISGYLHAHRANF